MFAAASFTLALSSSSADVVASVVTSTAAPVVAVSIYEESLCPACIGWFSGAFGPGTGAWAAYEALGPGSAEPIMTMEVVQWGNALASKADLSDLKCQHGPVECLAMKHENCAKGMYKNDVYLHFLDCFDTTLIKTFPAGLPVGTVNATYAAKVVSDCSAANSPMKVR